MRKALALGTIAVLLCFVPQCRSPDKLPIPEREVPIPREIPKFREVPNFDVITGNSGFACAPDVRANYFSKVESSDYRNN